LDSAAISVTFWLALSTTLTLLVVGLPLSFLLTTVRFPGRFLLESVVSLPMVLPPTVLGFYLLIAMNPTGVLGRLYEQWTGGTLPFSFVGIWLASVIYNLPFAVRPFMAGFESIDRGLMEAAESMGLSPWESFFRVAMPLAWPGIAAGMVLSFAHTVGEFGVVLMVGGNLPGVTRTLSVSIYDDMQALDYASAHRTSLALILFSMIVLSVTYSLMRRRAFP
jgi:molybdate transport system permease protein